MGDKCYNIVLDIWNVSFFKNNIFYVMPKALLAENIVKKINELSKFKRLFSETQLIRTINKMEVAEQKDLLDSIKFLNYIFYCSLNREGKNMLEYKRKIGEKNEK